MARADLPGGLVTFVFTDIVGSTGLVQLLGQDYPPMLIEHRRLLRRILAAVSGIELSVEGDGCLFVFSDAAAALDGCMRAQRELTGPNWPARLTRPAVRMGLSTGLAQPVDGEYISTEVHRAVRIATAAQGGQILCSAATAAHATATKEHTKLIDLGLHRLRGFDQQQQLFQLCAPGLEQTFPVLRSDRLAGATDVSTARPGRAQQASIRASDRCGHRTPDTLTRAESTVAVLVAEGMSNPQVAKQLSISRYTVETHLKHIFAKLAVSSRAALATTVTRRLGTQHADDINIHPHDEVRELHAAVLRGWVDPDTLSPQATPTQIVIPAQLPRDITDFTGRQKQVDSMIAWLTPPSVREATPAVAVCAVAGMGGIGKTTLAVHVAHQIAAQFPQGQLYVNLRDSHGNPTDATNVLEGFLRGFGVSDRKIPTDLERRVDVYRSILAGRRVLVVLDNAADEQQVRPLLPGSPTCSVLITSRVRLSSIEAVHRLDLDVLDPNHALRLLGRIAGTARVAAESDDAREIVRLCDRVPLALRIAGARLAARPRQPLSRLATVLGDRRRRLDELACGDLAVRATLVVSYRQLSESARRMFRLLGLLHTTELSPRIAAAAADTDPQHTERDLEALVDAQLLTADEIDTYGQPRYRFHDLVRLFAHERAHAQEPATVRNAVIVRALQAWLAVFDAPLWALPNIPTEITQEAPALLGELPDDLAKADTFAYLGRLHQLRFQIAPALAAAKTASDIAERLGLLEAAVDARVTIGTTRYLAGDIGGLLDLQQALQTSRSHGLRIWRRAANNLSWALMEEGDLAVSFALNDELIAHSPPDSPAAAGIVTDATRAYFDGDWRQFLSAAADLEAACGIQNNRTELFTSTWIGILRGEEVGQPTEDQLAAILAAAREHRPKRTMLAHLALIRALQNRHEETTQLLTRLVNSWRATGGIAFGEWVVSASHAAALAGPPTCELLHTAITEANHRTPWMQAALHTTHGGAAAHNNPETAFASHTAAADIYQRLRNISDRILALAAAHRSLSQHPHPPLTDIRREIEDFAHKNQAPGLLTIAGLVTNSFAEARRR